MENLQTLGERLFLALQVLGRMAQFVQALFLIFEPRGLYGIWLNIKSYFKRWPFSY